MPETGRRLLPEGLMFPLAHLGIGSAATRLCPVKLRFHWVLLGTMLPDLIDKPVFFLLGEAGKRGFAHTLLFLALLAAVSGIRKSPAPWAVTAGTATHLALDVISKSTEGSTTAAGSLRVLFWPLAGWSFPTLSHGMHGMQIWFFEMVGLALLALQCVSRYQGWSDNALRGAFVTAPSGVSNRWSAFCRIVQPAGAVEMWSRKLSEPLRSVMAPLRRWIGRHKEPPPRH